MRRKGLLLVVLAFFSASSILSCLALQSSASRRETPRITISDWGDPETAEVDIPRTGLADTFSVISPRDLINLPDEAPTESESKLELDPEDSEPESEPPLTSDPQEAAPENDFAADPTPESTELPQDGPEAVADIELPDTSAESIITTDASVEPVVVADLAVAEIVTPPANIVLDEPDHTADTDNNVVMNPTEVVTSSATPISSASQSHAINLTHDLFLGLCTVIVAVFCVYTAYWHFMR